MDDKEKEKFGVIIDKDKQPQDEQPKVEESTPVDEKIDNQVENNQTLEQKQPENENVLKKLVQMIKFPKILQTKHKIMKMS